MGEASREALPSLTNRCVIKELPLLCIIVGNTLHNNEAGEKGPSDSINNGFFLASPLASCKSFSSSKNEPALSHPQPTEK